MWLLVIFRSCHSLNCFESTLDKELFKGGYLLVRGSWARDWGLGALCSPRTELMGNFLLPLYICSPTAHLKCFPRLSLPSQSFR